MGFLCDSFGILMRLQWYSYGIPMEFLWDTYGFLSGFLLDSYGIRKVFVWYSYWFPIGFLLNSYRTLFVSGDQPEQTKNGWQLARNLAPV
jgi:hypothetical protein